MNKTQEKVLENILTKDELVEAKKYFIENTTNEMVFEYLKDKSKAILAVDWSGEEKNGDIGTFLQFRLKQENKNMLFDQSKVYNDLSKKIETGDIERGDAVPFILENFNKVLKKEEFKIVLFESGNDTYYIALASKEKDKKLKKIKDEYWKFSAFGSKRGEILYTINCPCGSMEVWQLKVSEPPPSDEYCQKCGKQLFDKDGNALLPLEKDYI